MTRTQALLAGALAGFSLLVGTASATDRDTGAPKTPNAQRFADDRVIVQWAHGADGLDRADARADADVSAGRRLGNPDFQLVRLEEGQTVAGAIDALEADPAVVVAEPDSYGEPHGAPNDPLFGELWGLRNPGGAFGVGGVANPVAGADINAIGAWVRTVGTASTVVAVIDTGHRFTHPDLGPVSWTNVDETAGNGIDDDKNGYVDDRRGYDFVGPSADSPSKDSDPNDDNQLSGGHGAHVAGTVGAKGSDGVGITGVAQDVRIMPLRVCAHSTSAGAARCPVSSQIEAINYARANGARVANMSLGGTTYSQAQVNAIAANPQTLYVISAGNDGQDNEATHHYPCDYRPTIDAAGTVDNIVCVAATTQADGLASFSDWGAVSVDLGAPGTEVLSVYPTTERYTETFSTNDFAVKWTATGANGGFSRSSEAPLASFGMTDTPGTGPTANTTRESTSTGFALPAGLGSCAFTQTRQLAVGTGNEYRYAVLLNDVPVFQSSAVTASGIISTVPIPELDAGGTVKIRQRYAVGSSPSAANGVWLDDFRLKCYESATSTSATFDYLQGTSMAAPHVAGAAALLFSYKPSATVTQVRTALLSTVDPTAALLGKTVTGGRLDAAAAMDSLDGEAPAAPQLTATPAGPANDNAPTLRGFAEELSTVRLYNGAGCSGAPFATVPAATLAVVGVGVSVPDDSTTTYSATATDTASNASACSGTLAYVEQTTPPQVPNPGPGPDGTTPKSLPTAKCRVPALKGKSLTRAKRALKAAGCALGKVKKPKGSKGKKLIVKSTNPRAGRERSAGTKVAVTLKVKPRPRRR